MVKVNLKLRSLHFIIRQMCVIEGFCEICQNFLFRTKPLIVVQRVGWWVGLEELWWEWGSKMCKLEWGRWWCGSHKNWQREISLGYLVVKERKQIENRQKYEYVLIWIIMLSNVPLRVHDVPKMLFQCSLQLTLENFCVYKKKKTVVQNR